MGTDIRHAPRLYTKSDLATGAAVSIEGDQAHYLRNVMRMKPGDVLRLFNGRDGEFLARLGAASKNAIEAIAEKQLRAQRAAPDLWLCAAPIKKAHFDYMIEKATELGVAVIQPILTARTQIREVNTGRARSIAIESAEQSERLDIPEIRAPITLTELIAQWPQGRTPIICAELGEAVPVYEAFVELQRGLSSPLAGEEAKAWAYPSVSEDKSLAFAGEGSLFRSNPSPAKTKGLAEAKPKFSLPLPQGERQPSAAIVTGPEGGFTEQEFIALHKIPNAAFIRLGPRILRADTAAIAALSLWEAICGDWK